MIRLMRDEKTNSGGAPLDANVSGGLCKRKRERPANTATAEFGDDGFDLTDLLKDLEAQEAAVAMDGPCFFLTECQILFVLLLE